MMLGEEKEEARPLISSNTSSILDQFDGRKSTDYIIDAIHNLKSITYISTSTILIVLALIFINQCIKNSIPLWAFFLVIFTGHSLLFIVIFGSLRCVFRTIQSECREKSRFRQEMFEKWHSMNAKMIQYLMFNLLCIFWISSLSLVFEILVLSSLLKVVPAYSFLIPIYIFTGFTFSDAIICRSSSIASSVSSLLLLVTAVLLQLKMFHFSKLSYSVVFIPSYIFLAYWFFVCIYIFVCDSLKVFHLKNIQYQTSIVFATSFLMLLVADIGLMEYLINPIATPECGGTIVISCFFLVGVMFFSFALVFNVSNGIDVTIKRMGGKKSKMLISRTGGGWRLNERSEKHFGIFLLIGDTDNGPKIDTINDEETSQNKNCSESFVNFILSYMLNNAQDSSLFSSDFENHRSFSRSSRAKANQYSILQGTQYTADDNNSLEPLL